MSQSTIIFAALLFAFIVFITVRGELPKYLGFFLGPVNQPAPTPYGSAASGGTGAAGILGGALGGISMLGGLG